ncbi:MAG: hypothetical protein KDD64_07460 [Bdellovibrionales bacterium]|nr:hypothetical protein [Bdellovibrionales bacterium]
MSQETFINYRQYRWFWITLAALVALTVVYLCDSPLGGPSGGTVLGYTYGGIATAGILYLMWFGIRKRSYYAKHTTLKGCLAAHIWVGIALLFIVPLHSGFSFGLNVHTLAYVLMVFVIGSGIWGALNYATLADEIQAHRGGGTSKALIEQIDSISRELEKALSGQKSDSLTKLVRSVDVPFEPSFSRYVAGKGVHPLDSRKAGALLSDLPSSEREEGASLVGLVSKKLALMKQLQDDVATMFWLKVWLYVHVPVSIALVACVTVHIFSVFYLW